MSKLAELDLRTSQEINGRASVADLRAPVATVPVRFRRAGPQTVVGADKVGL